MNSLKIFPQPNSPGLYKIIMCEDGMDVYAQELTSREIEIFIEDARALNLKIPMSIETIEVMREHITDLRSEILHLRRLTNPKE